MRMPADAVQAARDAGMAAAQAAADHADRDVPLWTELALACLAEQIRKASGEFTIEELRSQIPPDTLPEPPDLRAWGQVTQMARRQGLLEPTGNYRPAVSSHASAKPCYRAAWCAFR